MIEESFDISEKIKVFLDHHPIFHIPHLCTSHNHHQLAQTVLLRTGRRFAQFSDLAQCC